tara:strand:- start:79 stop:543 length:465 start_codon:yes stop_codon:yes gene_type:complete
MSDSEMNPKIFEVKEKPKKKKREMTAERKAQLLENLKKGRETSKINRRKNKIAKEIKKKDKYDETDKIIKDDMLKNVEYNDMKKEIERLRNELKEKTIKEEPVEEHKIGKGIAQPDEPINKTYVPLRERNLNKKIKEPTDELQNISLFNTNTFY